MANIDDRVVAMSFENDKFQKGTADTLSSLDKLKSALKFEGATKGFNDIDAAAKKTSFGGLTSGAEAVAGKFSAMSVAAVAAIGAIAVKAAYVGLDVAKSLTIAPVTGGLKEYETQLNAVQTILANTQAAGTKLKDVNAALKELNTYSDKTIYNFTEMAKNIGTFTAAGVDLKTATGSIKGIANLAALSGSNSQQASTAMYQLSQAISAGRVSLQDWNSVVNAGMGGTVFQRALAQNAQKMGKLSDGAVELKGKMKNVTIEGQSFRESIQAKPGEKSWLTSDVLTRTLEQFTGDLSAAELKAQGFNKAEIKAIMAQAKMATNAATQVKTLSQVLDTAKETAESGWAQTWQIIFGNFGEAKTLFTGLSNAVNGIIGNSAKARNALLKDWKELGGRTELIESIKNIFEALGAIIEPIKDAFRDIFPATTGKQLYELTTRFRDFTEQLKIGPETADNLKRTFRGLFAILDIGKQIVFGIFTVIGHLFGALADGSGGTLEFTGNVGDLLVKLDEWLKKGDRLKNFFAALGDILAVPVQLIGGLKDALVGLFTGVNGDGLESVGSALSGMGDALKPGQAAIDAMSGAWGAFVDVLREVKDLLQPVIDSVVEAFGTVIDGIGDAIANSDFDAIFQGLQTALIGGLFLTVRKALKGGLSFDLGGDALKSMAKSMDVFGGSLKSIQQNIKANTLLQIATAAALLAGAVLVISGIDPPALTRAMTAITVGLGQLMGAMALITKVGGAGGLAKIPVIAASMILLATALNVLALAVKQFSTLSWDELLHGLAGVAGSMVAIAAGIVPLQAATSGMMRSGAGLIVVGAALRVIAESVQAFGEMEWETIGRGLAGIAGALVAIGLAMNLVPPSVLLIGPGLAVVGIALGTIAGAVLAFGSMDVATLAKGIGAIAASLVAIGLAVGLMPPTMILSAAALVLVGIALAGVAGAVALFGSMDWGTLIKGVTGLAATLVVLAVGLTGMVAALPGAVALMAAAAALAVLTPVLGILGTMKWSTIFKGIGAIAAAILAIGLAGTLAGPGLVLLGAGIAALGGGMLAVGLGINLLAKGLSILGRDGAKGVAIVIAALTGLVAILPKVIIDFISGLVKIIAAIADIAPKVVDSLLKIIESLLDVIIRAAPKFAEAVTAIITAILKIISENFQPILDAGWQLLKHLLQGMADNIGEVTDQVSAIIRRFLDRLTERIPAIVAAGAHALAALLRGMADNIQTVAEQATRIVTKFIGAIANHIEKIIEAGANVLAKFLSGIIGAFGDVVDAGARAIVKFVKGLGENAADIIEAGTKAAGKFIKAIGEAMLDLIDEAGQAILNFLEGLRRAVDKYAPQITEAAIGIGKAMASGIFKGLKDAIFGGGLGGVIDDLEKQIREKIKAHSPSLVYAEVGKDMMDGIVLGLDRTGPKAVASIEETSNVMATTLRAALSAVDDVIDVDPTITPVLDLSSVEKSARDLSDLLNVVPISAAASYDAAASISAAQAETPDSDISEPVEGTRVVKFEQNNYSPEALTAAEIYRLTHNQFAQAKDALGV